ncbi:TBC1 domain family member 13 [Nymphaea thermarum]|nr:TBC1 domain family member 13 [Nymphaea thermarum]
MDRSVPDWMKSSLWSSFDDRHHAIVDAAEIPIPRSSIPPNQPDTAVLPPPPQRVVSSPPAPLSHHAPETPRSTPAPPLEDASHGDRFHAALSKRNIDLAELRMLTAEGVPDSGGIRSVLWKVLLGYLPTNRDLWAEELRRKRAQYASFKEELLLSPSELARRLEKFNAMENEDNCEGSCLLHRSEITHGEHPLSLGETSIWNKFFQDTEIMKQIDRDIKRTHPDMDFFCGDSPSAKLNQEALKHVLAVFAKLNPGIQYVQGMNEILAPLFYVFRNDADEQNAAQAEPDSFFCFVTLLSGFRDHFCQQLDNSIVGIRSTMSRLTQILREHDEELWCHLEITTKVNPQFYAFRWITLLLTQEFNFTDSLHIWDALLSDPDGPLESLLRLCCAMLILIRKRLLAGDFTSNLKLLQNYPSTSVNHLLDLADKLRGLPIL